LVIAVVIVSLGLRLRGPGPLPKLLAAVAVWLAPVPCPEFCAEKPELCAAWSALPVA